MTARTADKHAVGNLLKMTVTAFCGSLVVKNCKAGGAAAAHKLSECAIFIHSFKNGVYRLQVMKIFKGIVHTACGLFKVVCIQSGFNVINIFMRKAFITAVKTGICFFCTYSFGRLSNNYETVSQR